MVEKANERYITNTEIRNVLLNANEEFRSHILWQVERWARDEDENNEDWLAMLPEFFEDVWPRQKTIRTPMISALLSNLLFLNTKFFPNIAEMLIPRLTIAQPDRLMLPDPEEDCEIADRYPKMTLDILYTILSEDVSLWPYGVESLLKRIIEIDPKLKYDYHYIELKRRWNSR